MSLTWSGRFFALVALVGFISGCDSSKSGSETKPNEEPAVTITNVSYDPTREFYDEFNQAFAEHWSKQANQSVTIQQSHAGSGSQARKVIDGTDADVVTLALAFDIDAIAARDIIAADWQSKLPHHSSPYTSTIVFLVRKGNPKGIKDWDDLTKDGIEVITPNPKTGGGARWNYLAGWGAKLKQELGDFKKLKDPDAKDEVAAAQAKAKDYVIKLFKNAKVLDPSARASTNTFVQRGIGDVLITWENEAFLATNNLGKGEFEIVVPKTSILAEPPVAIVDRNVDKNGTRKVAEAYLKHLYSPAGQQMAAKHYYRPADSALISEEQRGKFAQVELFTIDDVFGGWKTAQAEHFADGGVFDDVLKAAKQ